MNFININIKSADHSFPYIIEYQHTDNIMELDDTYGFRVDGDYIGFWGPGTNLVREGNDWRLLDRKTNDISNTSCKVSYADLYFPLFSADTYQNHVLYALTLNTWIHDRRVYLGTYLLSRTDAVASPTHTFIGNRYYEKIRIQIPNVYELTYSDDWKEFREELCGEIPGTNDSVSEINCSLYVVEESDYEGAYIMADGFTGGQNSIQITNGSDNDMRVILKADRIRLVSSLIFNTIYKTSGDYFTMSDLNDYLQETYPGLIEDSKFRVNFQFIVKDSSDVYYGPLNVMYDYDPNTVLHCEIKHADLMKGKGSGLFESWTNWKEGMMLVCGFELLRMQGNEPLLYLLSDELPLTQDVFKFLVGNNPIEYINLDDIDMNNYNINAVNKVVNNIIQVDKPDDPKSNIIQPVFFRSHSSSSIVVHPEVSEFICVNLDVYKSKVSSFIMQIEKIQFKEYGRVEAGVMFKVEGQLLPGEIENGTYYILDQDGVYVTSGKYAYER